MSFLIQPLISSIFRLFYKWKTYFQIRNEGQGMHAAKHLRGSRDPASPQRHTRAHNAYNIHVSITFCCTSCACGLYVFMSSLGLVFRCIIICTCFFILSSSKFISYILVTKWQAYSSQFQDMDTGHRSSNISFYGDKTISFLILSTE